jgi:hypothetical protein
MTQAPLEDKLSKGAAMLREQGHRVHPYFLKDEKGRIVEWWKVDEYLATPQEIENLADGIYSFAQLEECYIKRRADEARAAGSS